MHPNAYSVTAVTDAGETVSVPLVCVDFGSLDSDTGLVRVDMPDKSTCWVEWDTVRLKGQVSFEDEARLKLMDAQIAKLECDRAAHLKRIGVPTVERG